jgi:hypothetical protein
VAADTIARQLAQLIGSVLIVVGAGLALFPRVGRTVLVDHVAKMPQPLAGGIARPVRERELPRGVAALAAWVNRLVLEPDQCLERFAATDTRQGREGSPNAMHRVWESGTLFDFVATDWEGQLAQAFRQAVKTRSGKSLKTLALQPVLWAEGITRQLQDPQEGGWVSNGDPLRLGSGSQSRTMAIGDPPRCELTSVFALQIVRAWIESHTLAELLSFLNIDLARFGSLVGRLACVHWPTPRVDPDISAGVIAVGKPLWDAMAPLVNKEGKKAGNEDGRNIPPSCLRTFLSSSSGASLVLLDWDSRDNRIVVLRAVQGLTQGWRGFPGMPGQFHEQCRPAPVPT